MILVVIISFLFLFNRVVGFVGMVLVLWSPVVIPLLPTLVQSWSTSTPSRVAELASVVGLYIAVFMLVMLWGKRVRKYENPFRQYGLDFKTSAKKQVLYIDRNSELRILEIVCFFLCIGGESFLAINYLLSH